MTISHSFNYGGGLITLAGNGLSLYGTRLASTTEEVPN